MSHTRVVTDNTFEENALRERLPVLVDFWAEWCGPCKMIGPVLEEVAREYEGRLHILKMNVDDNKEVPARFGIRSIPTLILFKDGEVLATKVGALNKSGLVAFLDEHKV